MLALPFVLISVVNKLINEAVAERKELFNSTQLKLRTLVSTNGSFGSHESTFIKR